MASKTAQAARQKKSSKIASVSKDLKKLIFGSKSAKQKPAPVPTKTAKAAPTKAAAPAKAVAATKAPIPTPAPAPKTRAPRSSSGRSSRRELAAGDVCREVACEGLATAVGYCRLHYIKNWKKIKRKELILKEGKLNQYIEELVTKYPDKYIEAIRQDLANDKDFAKVIYDLDLDESADDFEVDGENADALIDTIKRDFDDEGEGGF